MSFIKSEDSKKWINALVAIFSGIVGFVFYKFALQLSVWFDLEAKIAGYASITQALGAVVGIGTFFFVINNKKSFGYLEEVYNELLKVVWPTKDQTVKITVGLLISLVIVSAIFVTVDLIFKKILEFVY